MKLNYQKLSRKDKGFTLIEVLIVMIVIGIISSIAVLGLKAAQRTSIVASCKVDVSSVYSAALAYLLDNPVPNVILVNGTADLTKANTSENPLYPQYLQPISSKTNYYRVKLSYTSTISNGITTYTPQVSIDAADNFEPNGLKINRSNPLFLNTPEENCSDTSWLR